MVDLEQIEIERAQRKELLAEQRRQQHAIDVARLNELEIEHGDDGVARVDVGRYAPGLPTLVVVRALKKAELKRFRDRVRGEGADNAAAAEEAAIAALLYPSRDSDEWRALLDAVPGVLVRAGVAAVELAAGIERATGK